MSSLSFSILLVVALGGAVGSTLRYLCTIALNAAFPTGTLVVNVIGCALMGIMSAIFAIRWPDAQHLRLFLTVGCLGGFTTFSSFAADIGRLTEDGAVPFALIYAIASLVLSIGGFFFMQSLTRAALS